jgi:hypothetical protein
MTSCEIKCFWLNYLQCDCQSLLILVTLGCFDSYKFDYCNSLPQGS